MGLKAPLQKKTTYQKKFTLRAVCPAFVRILDIGQIHFQIIEHKLVQHCETHIGAQSYGAS